MPLTYFSKTDASKQAKVKFNRLLKLYWQEQDTETKMKYNNEALKCLEGIYRDDNNLPDFVPVAQFEMMHWAIEQDRNIFLHGFKDTNEG